MGLADALTILLSIASAAMLAYWIVCLIMLLRKDGAERLHRR
jgi:hypothetical protein